MSTNTTSAIIGAGTLLGYATIGGTSFTTLGELMDVKQPKVDVTKVDATHYTSPNNAKEKIPGYLDAGEIEFTVNYLKAQTTTAYALLAQNKAWKITLPDASTWAFNGFLSHWEGETPMDNKIQNKGNICVSGLPVFTAGS